MRKRVLAALVLASVACWNVPLAMAHTSPAKDSPSPAVHDHSCCPGSHARLALPVLITTPAPMNMPCGENHPCCMKQAPSGNAALPALNRISRPDWSRESVEGNAASVSRRTMPAENTERAAFDLYLLRSTVLRI